MTNNPLNRLLTAALWTGILAAANLAVATDIVKDGQPTARIVVAEKPTRMQWMAAFELRDYLKKISGAELPIDSKPAADGIVNVFVGDSPGAKAVGVTSEGLDNGAYRMVSGKDWLALIGNDANFEPVEPWGRNHGQGQKEVVPKLDEKTKAKWSIPMATSMYRNYSGKAARYEKDQQITPTKSEDIQFWRFDKKGSLNAVYAFLRRLGVRWYMPGEVGEILPEMKTIPLPKVDETVEPDVKIRSMSWDRYHALSRDQLMWSLRLGLNHLFAPMHHGIANITRREEQRKLHPEFYQVLPNGEHDVESRRPKACLSCPGLFEENVRYANAMFDMYDVPIVSVMPQDGFTRICQCEKCKDKATPERGRSGCFSDYVWEYVNKVAKEVEKTHPHKLITCGAYSTYQMPPTKIGKFNPNVIAQITNGRPRTELDPEVHKKLDDLRRCWLAKTEHPISNSINYHFSVLPFYVPHVIDKGLKDSKGQLWREDLWFMPFSKEGLFKPAVNHLAIYLISRLWWDQDTDADQILDEYYAKFYGPAKDEMKTFVDYVETNYGELLKNKKKTDRAFELFEAVKKKVDPDSVYGERVALVDQGLNEWRKRAKTIGKERDDAIEYTATFDFDDPKHAKVKDTLVMDGKLDEPFWTENPAGGELKELITGGKPKHGGRFMTRWKDGNLYVGIRCDDQKGDPANIASKKDGDWLIWEGDFIELILETADHQYYQIVTNPAGAVLDLDRGTRTLNEGFKWSSKAEVAAHVGDDYWSAEVRIPVTSSDNDPLHEIIGHKPTKDAPWFFNVCRRRIRDKDVEISGFSPTKKKKFHVVDKFAKMYIPDEAVKVAE